jgi:hypothetical protein
MNIENITTSVPVQGWSLQGGKNAATCLCLEVEIMTKRAAHDGLHTLSTLNNFPDRSM